MAAQFTTLIEFVGASMNPMQIHECAQLAYDQYYWLTLAEFKQFILRVKTSYYTSNKNLTALVLMEFLKEYTDERLEARYDHFSQQKPKFKRPTVLSVEKMQGRNLKMARRLCRIVEQERAEQMQAIKANIEQIAVSMGQPVRNIMQEEEYQRIRSEYLTKQMQQRL